MQQTSESTLSISELLAHLTKNQLDMIRRAQQVKNASSLNKKELILRLSEHIITGLDDQLEKFDMQRYGMLQKVLSRGGVIPFDEIVSDVDYNPAYFVETGCLFINNEQGVVEMPLEIREKLKNVNKPSLEAMLARNTEWINLAKGLLFYYGTLGLKPLSELITKYANESLNFRECYELIYEYNRYDDFVPLSQAGFSYYMVEDPQSISSEHKARPTVAYYPFTKKQLLLASDEDFVERHEAYLQFVQFLTQNWDMDEEDADMMTENLTYGIQNGESHSDLIAKVQTELDFDTMEQVQQFVEILMNLMNQTRQWALKGHKPTDLSAKKKKDLKPLPKEPFKTSSAEVYDFKTKQKVGRNDPCPCGSGKKYKKCCGG